MEIVSQPIDWIIYNNLLKLIQCRKLKITSDIIQSSQELILMSHVVVKAVSEDEEHYSFVQLFFGTDSYKTDKLRKIISGLSGKKIIIKSEEVKINVSIIYDEVISDNILFHDRVEHNKASGIKLRKLDADEEALYAKKLFTSKDSFAMISILSADCVWYDFKKGDLIEYIYTTDASSLLSANIRQVSD